MEFVKSVSDRKQLRQSLIDFYLDENALVLSKNYCEFDLKRVSLFIDLKRDLMFDIFNILVDYLVSIIRHKTKQSCFHHLSIYNCFHYFPLSHTTGKTLSLVEFFQKYNFNLTEVFRVLNVTSCQTKYGAYLVKFCCGSIAYKTWLPQSGYMTLCRTLEYRDPQTYNYYDREVYFKVDYFTQYRGNRYAVINVRREPR